MKKLITISLLVMLMLATGVLSYDIQFINGTPVNNSQLPVNNGNVFFGIETNDTITSANLWIDGIDKGNMAFAGNQSTMSLNLIAMTDGTTHSWYPILNSIVGPTYWFIVNNIPLTPTGLTVVTSNESSVELNWNDNIEGDLAGYKLYRNGLLINQTTLLAYLDSGLITGTSYNYQVSAIDNIGQESALSGIIVGTAQDTTPPTTPAINPSSGSIINYSYVPVQISYTENVTLKIYSGGIMIANLGNGLNFNWAVNFTTEGTAFYKLKACDQYNNCLNTNYILTYDDGTVTPLNFTIIEGTFWISPEYFMVVDQTTAGGDIVLGMNLYYNNINDIRIMMSDLIGTAETLMVNEETQPFMFCNIDSEGYWDGTGYTYDIDNVVDFGQPGLDYCTDYDASDAVNTTVYVQIPIPTGTKSGDYNFGIDFNYNVTI